MKYLARMLAMLTLLLFICACQPIVRPSDQPAPDLFTPIAPTDDRVADLEPVNDPTVARQRYVEINDSVLTDRITDPAADVGPAESVSLPLFDDVTVEVIPESIEQVSSTTTNWVGRVEGSALNNVVLVIRDGSITGDVIVDDTLYQIRPAGEDVQSITEIDQSGFPAEADPEESEQGSSEEGSSSNDGGESTNEMKDGSVIDILVVYTPDARIAATGFITDEINLAILETNTSFANHGLEVRVHLVYSDEVNYQETGGSIADLQRDRERLRLDGDGFLDTVHDLREQYAADVVSLWIAVPGPVCGIGYIMNPVSTAFADHGFFVVKQDCATGNYSFAHELGHILGARHDRFMDKATGPFIYNYGYVDIAHKRRTIMGYNDACDCSDEVSPCPTSNARRTRNQPYCQRLPNWSDPSFLMEDGVAIGIASSEADAADNRLTISNTAPVVASFRSSITITPPISPTSDIEPQDCLPYNPANLTIVDEGASGWLLTDNVSRMLILDNETDARNALALAQRHTAHCFIGRDNPRPNRRDYIVEYWMGDSDLVTTIEPEDCLPYDPANLTIVNEGATGWLLKDNVSRMLILDNEADARNALALTHQYAEQCFIGRNNTRPNRKDYIVAYWQQHTGQRPNEGQPVVTEQVVIVVPLATNASIIEKWAAAHAPSINIQVDVVTKLEGVERAQIFVAPREYESVLANRLAKKANIITFYGGDFLVQTVGESIYEELAADLANEILPQLTLEGLPVELPENVEITPVESEPPANDIDIFCYKCGEEFCYFLS